jgi:DNA-binding CsgD family transcriptional regulator
VGDDDLVLLAAKCREASIGNYDWADLLGDVTGWVDGDKALWLTGDAVGPYQYGLQCGHDPNILTLYNSGYNALDPRRHQARDTKPGQAVPGQRYLPNHEVAHTDYFETINIGGDVMDSCFGVLCDDPGIGRHGISIQRGFKEEFFNDDDAARLSAVIPHLTEALRHSISLTRVLAHKNTQSSGGFGFLDANWNFLELEHIASALLSGSDAIELVGETISCRTDQMKKAFQYAFGKALGGEYFYFRAPWKENSRSEQLVLEFAPIPNAVRWIAQDRPRIMLTVSLEHHEFAKLARFFAETNNLSKKEEILIGALLEHDDLRDVAKATRISYETVRWHLKSIFAKTGHKRREDLLNAVRHHDLS